MVLRNVQGLLTADPTLAAGFARARFLVLDEADRLLEPTFEVDIKHSDCAEADSCRFVRRAQQEAVHRCFHMTDECSDGCAWVRPSTWTANKQNVLLCRRSCE